MGDQGWVLPHSHIVKQATIFVSILPYERTFGTLLINLQSFHINLGNKTLTTHYQFGGVGKMLEDIRD